MSNTKMNNMIRNSLVAFFVVAQTAFVARAVEFDSVTLQTNDWFEASMSNVVVGTAITQGTATGITKGAGSWTAVPTSGIATIATDGVNNFISIAAVEQSEKLTFTPLLFAVTSGYETVTAKIHADVSEEVPVVDVNSQAAFTVLLTNSTLQAIGYTRDGWTNLVCSCTDDLTNSWFTIYMDFVNDGENRYVRYSVEPEDSSLEVLTNSAGKSWFPTAYSPTINRISFSGYGKVQVFSGDELTVPVTFGNTEITYLASYQTATTVVASVSGTVAADTTFSMTFGDDNYYNGVYDGASGNVTFYNVGGSLVVGETPSYTIEASSTSGYTGGTSDSKTTTVGTKTDGWIVEDAEQSGSGTWTTNGVTIAGLTYTDSKAALKDHLFTPTNSVNGAVVTVNATVCFNGRAESNEIDNSSYAAVKIDKLSDDDPTLVFKVYAKEAEDGEASWIPVFGEAGAVLDAEEGRYDLRATFDFNKKTCNFAIGEHALANATGMAEFWFANDSKHLKAIAFNGSSTFTSLTGSYVAAEGISVDVGDAHSVEIDRTWVAANFSGKTIDEARALITNSTVTTSHGGSSYNYFECYALGLDPEDATEAPIVIGEPAANGKINMSLAGIKVPAGVTVTATLKKSASPNDGFTGDQFVTAIGRDEGTTATGTIEFDPAEDMVGDNVKYMKMEISIGKTTP